MGALIVLLGLAVVDGFCGFHVLSGAMIGLGVIAVFGLTWFVLDNGERLYKWIMEEKDV